MRYDIAIVGGGPAGYSAALEGLSCGLSVVLFESRDLGGTCLNRGCVPTKHLLHHAALWRAARCAGYVADEARFARFSDVCSEGVDVVRRLRESLGRQMRSGGIEIVDSAARIVDDHTVECDGKRYAARNLLIATGSKPADPAAEGSVTSDELLAAEALPERLHVLGSGVVAVEFASVFSQLGVPVTMTFRAKRPLRKWDRDIAVGVSQALRQMGVRLEPEADVFACGAAESEVMLSALGRVPVIPDAPEELFGLGEHGGIVVDEHLGTGARGVYAAGDVLDESPQLAHVAMEQGRRVARMVAGMDDCMPAAVVSCIYLGDVEAASVGLKESDARELGVAYEMGRSTTLANARCVLSGAGRGFVKVLVDRETHHVLGAHLLCPAAGEIACELALAMNNDLTVEELLSSTRPHPGYAEMITEAARVVVERLRRAV